MSHEGYWKAERCASQRQTGPDCCRGCNSETDIFAVLGHWHQSLHHRTDSTVNHLSYNLASAGVLVCVRRSSDVVPHLSGRHDQDKTLRYRDGPQRRNILLNIHKCIPPTGHLNSKLDSRREVKEQLLSTHVSADKHFHFCLVTQSCLFNKLQMLAGDSESTCLGVTCVR